MKNLISLNDLEIGQRAVIKRINCEQSLKERLNDIGMLEGEFIKLIFESPFKTPRAYRVKNTVLALRRSDGAKITVSLNSDFPDSKSFFENTVENQ